MTWHTCRMIPTASIRSLRYKMGRGSRSHLFHTRKQLRAVHKGFRHDQGLSRPIQCRLQPHPEEGKKRMYCRCLSESPTITSRCPSEPNKDADCFAQKHTALLVQFKQQHALFTGSKTVSDAVTIIEGSPKTAVTFANETSSLAIQVPVEFSATA